MRWFDGSIPSAIHSAKQQGVMFVVVIAGDDEQSKQLMSSWEDGRVSQAVHNCCVAIKVDAKSETCVQFSQIYPVVCIPSCFFIGEKGIPLEVIAGSVSTDELLTRISRVKQMHAQQTADGTGPADGPLVSSPSEPAEGSRPSSAAAEAAGPATTEASSNTSQDVLPAYNDPGTSQQDENLDAKVERLTKKLEERREQRKKGEEEDEIRKEMERRKLGKDMLDFRRKQEDEKNKRLLEERNREKLEEKAARERVRQQIAMDRADRAARYAQSQEEREAARQSVLRSSQAEQEAAVRHRSTTARIQFRLPDGSSFTNQFPSGSKLQEVHQFVVQEVGNRYGNFSLATMFPRREFSAEDLNRTLQDLDLSPSAAIALLPQSNSLVQSSGGGMRAVLGTLLYPLLAVWRFLSSFLFGAPPPPAATRTGPAPPSSSYTSSPSVSDKPQRKPKSVETQPKDFKKDGKICRLRTQEDSEDENNTWNGNSTQQM